LDSCAATILPVGSGLLSSRAPIGHVAINTVPLATNQGFKSFVPKSNLVHAKFLYYWLRANRDYLEGLGNGATFKEVSKTVVSRIEIPLPPLPEQQRIAEVLDRAAALRAKRRSALDQLDTLTQSVFLDMFGDPKTNDRGWRISQVELVAEVQGGLQVSNARNGYPREVPYLRVANVFRGFLDLTEVKTLQATDAEIARTGLAKGDLLIVEGHGNPEEIGRGALWDGSIDGCVHQNHLIRVRFDRKKVDPLFACEYLNSPGGRRHLLRAGKTTSGLNTINVSEVRAAPIALPPICDQREFARRVAATEKLRKVHRASLVQLDGLFASLQHAAFRGDL
jgi:type I restriction enzyme S subunit